VRYVVFDINSGFITRVAYLPSYETGFIEGSEDLLPYDAGNLSDLEHYVDLNTMTVVPRPDNLSTLDKTTVAADGTDLATISGIPAGSVVRITGQPEQTITDGVLELTFDTPGTYKIRIQSFPEKDTEFTIVAT